MTSCTGDQDIPKGGVSLQKTPKQAKEMQEMAEIRQAAWSDPRSSFCMLSPACLRHGPQDAEEERTKALIRPLRMASGKEGERGRGGRRS